jgi:hypothetical protein
MNGRRCRGVKGHPARYAGVLGLTALVGWLATAEDRRIMVADSARGVVNRALQSAVLRQPSTPAVSPFLRTVSWADVGPGWSFEGWADAVSRQPRRAGPFTLLSYYDLVAVNVRIRVNGADSSGRRLQRDPAQETFQQLRRTTSALRAMVRDGSPTEPGHAVVLTRTFLAGVVIEGFFLEGAEGPRGGFLRSRLMTSAEAGEGWVLQDVEAQAADGRRLTIARATWKKDGSLEASGPYTLVRGTSSREGPEGRFSIDPGDSLTFRRLPALKTLPFAIVPGPAVTSPQLLWPVPVALSHHGRGSRATLPLVEQLLHVLPTQPTDRPGCPCSGLPSWIASP